MPGSPHFVDAVKMFLKAMVYVEPGQKKSIALDLPPGVLKGVDR